MFLLSRHRDHKPLFNAKHVVDVLGGFVDIDLHPINLSVEFVAASRVVLRNWLTEIAADFHRFIERKIKSNGAFNASFTDLSSVNEKGDLCSFAQTSTVVVELHAHLMLAGRKRRGRLNTCLDDGHEVVVIFQPSLVSVETPARHRSALRDDDSFSALARYLDFGRNRVTLVLCIDRGILAEAAHTRKQQLG